MKRILVCFLICFLISPSIYAANNRLRAHQQKEEYTVEDIQAEIEFGKEVASRIIGQYPLIDNDRLTRYINLVGKSLAQNTDRPELRFTFGVLATETINAFSAPGGYIFITKGAIDAMENEAQLAGALSHEIIHVTQKHIVKELNLKASDSSAISGFAQIVGGSFDTTKVAFNKVVGDAMNILFSRGYKVQDEIEADTKGAVLMACAEYDPSEMISFFKIMKNAEDNKISDMKKLYPPFDDRIDAIEKIIKKEGLENGKFQTKGERFNEYTQKTN